MRRYPAIGVRRRPQRVIVLVVALLASSLASTATAPAAVSPSQLSDCFKLTTREALRSKQITRDLGLTVDQVKELRARLATYNSVRGFAGLDGLGLTGAQRAEIMRRIQLQVDEWNRHPVGWPCGPFKSKARVVLWVHDRLVFDGFRPSTRVWVVSPRQIRIDGVQDGVRMDGVVVRTGTRQIAVRLDAWADGWSGSYRFTLPFPV